jgi:hypothetical protein
MTVEDARVRLRAKFETAFGAEEASILMDRPPGGWSDLVTNQMLDAKLGELRFELVATMEQGFKEQAKWLATLVITSQGVMFAALAGVGALLRFA